MCPFFFPSQTFKLVITSLGKKDKKDGYVLQYWNRAMPAYISHLTSETYALCRTPDSFVGL